MLITAKIINYLFSICNFFLKASKSLKKSSNISLRNFVNYDQDVSFSRQNKVKGYAGDGN